MAHGTDARSRWSNGDGTFCILPTTDLLVLRPVSRPTIAELDSLLASVYWMYCFCLFLWLDSDLHYGHDQRSESQTRGSALSPCGICLFLMEFFITTFEPKL
jgi:hypothetical protein